MKIRKWILDKRNDPYKVANLLAADFGCKIVSVTDGTLDDSATGKPVYQVWVIDFYATDSSYWDIQSTFNVKEIRGCLA